MRSRGAALWIALASSAMGCGFNANDPIAEAPVASLDDPPPPVSGGTLLVTQNQRFAIASDPDRSAVFVVALGTTGEASVVRRVEAPARSEPGRVVEDDTGAVHVVLRGAGALLTIDPERASVIEQRNVCAEPRGVTFDPTSFSLWVACARGELVSLPTRGTSAMVRLKIDPDARDVVVGPDRNLWVSFFRSAAIEVMARDGRRLGTRLIARTTLTDRNGNSRMYQPSTLWRMRATTSGVAVSNQFAFIGPEREEDSSGDSYSYSREQQGWRDPCDNSVAPASVRLLTDSASAERSASMLVRGVLPVDVAVSRGGQVAVAFAGELGAFRSHGPQVSVSSVATVSTRRERCIPEDRGRRFDGQVVAVDFVGETLVAQTREPARLFVGDRRIDLATDARRDTGHDYFHGDLGGGIACASCHAEGGDDGHVWNFRATGPLRTPSLYALRSDGPYHRRGDVRSLRALLDQTMSARMSGPTLDDTRVAAMRRWITRIRVPTAVAVEPAVERGQAVFRRADTQCATCHSGESLTDGRAHSLSTTGTGERWMTPSLLGLSMRAPYMHNGCATTLGATLTGCGGNNHGSIRTLTEDEREDLFAYLRSL
ncbi:MAG: c-type cytochrome [Myxococcales bacterium]|nr:c-type cytochrome [Myxococcales bacterium]